LLQLRTAPLIVGGPPTYRNVELMDRRYTDRHRHTVCQRHPMPQKYRGAHDVAPTGGTIGIGTGRTDGAGIGGTCGGGLAVTQSFGRETDDGKRTRFWIESFCAIVSRSGSQRPSRVVSSTSTAV